MKWVQFSELQIMVHNWTLEETNTTNLLSGVFFTDANNGTVVGDGGVILRTSGPSPNYITANLKVYLEGPYNGSGAMTTTLNTNNLIPLNSNTAYSNYSLWLHCKYCWQYSKPQYC